MRIRVIWSPDRHTVNPDPATARVGENVVWELRVESSDPRFNAWVVWTIYFEGDSPYNDEGRQWSAQSPPGESTTIEPGPVHKPGKYKYGIKAINGATNEPLGDDDPTLIVKL